MKLKLVILVFFLLCLVSTANGHSDQTHDTNTGKMSLSLEIILILTVITGVILLVLLTLLVGIEDKRFIVKIGLVSFLFLLADYGYVKFLR